MTQKLLSYMKTTEKLLLSVKSAKEQEFDL